MEAIVLHQATIDAQGRGLSFKDLSRLEQAELKYKYAMKLLVTLERDKDVSVSCREATAEEVRQQNL